MISQCTGRSSMPRSLMMSVTSCSCSRLTAVRVVEVEAQLIRADVRALLAGAFAEHVLERAMQQMGRRVVPARPIPPRRVDCPPAPARRRARRRPRCGRSARCGRQRRTACRRRRTAPPGVRIQPASPSWPPPFGIERRRLEHQPRATASPELGRGRRRHRRSAPARARRSAWRSRPETPCAADRRTPSRPCAARG